MCFLGLCGVFLEFVFFLLNKFYICVFGFFGVFFGLVWCFFGVCFFSFK